MAFEIYTLMARVNKSKIDWKYNWKEDAKDDWKEDWSRKALGNFTITNSVAPAVTGDSIVGSTLSCTSGTWTTTWPQSQIIYEYQWYLDSEPVEDAITNTFVIPADSEGLDIICQVVARTPSNFQAQNSNAITVDVP